MTPRDAALVERLEHEIRFREAQALVSGGFNNHGERLVALLRSAAEALREPTWQKMETAPKDGRWIMLWLPSPLSYCVLARWLDDEESGYRDWQKMGGDNPTPKPLPSATHWMPLPAAPPATEDR